MAERPSQQLVTDNKKSSSISIRTKIGPCRLRYGGGGGGGLTLWLLGKHC